MTRKWLQAALALILAIAVLQWHAHIARRSWSVTVDETFMLATAVNTSAGRRLDPRLFASGTAPLPILIQWLPMLAFDAQPERFNHWSGKLDDPIVVDSARWLTSLLVGNGLVALIFGWLYVRRGLFWGAAGAWLVACSPMWVAHSSLATSDALAALTWVLCMAAFVFCFAKPRFERFLLAGAACGLAIAAKYSGIALIGAFGMLWIARARPLATVDTRQESAGVQILPRHTWPERLWGLWGFVVAALAVCWGLHGFELARVSNTFGEPLPTNVLNLHDWADGFNLPAPVAAILSQLAHNQRGHPAMLLGDVELGGWWYYFPVVAFLKSTPAEMVLGLVLCGSVAWRFVPNRTRRLSNQPSQLQLEPTMQAMGGGDAPAQVQLVQPDESRDVSPAFAQRVWWVTLATGVAMLLIVRVQIGYRYALPLLPVALLIGLDLLACWAPRNARGRLMRVATLGLCALQGWSLLSASPDYLSYATPLIGGGANAFRFMADSNVDWGQDLPALRDALDTLAADPQRVALCYFGTALPEAYGLRCTRVNDLAELNGRELDYLAISVNRLYGIQATDPKIDDAFRKLLDVAPIASAGHSIFIFKVDDLHLGSEEK